jgi:hypothetical protein
MVDQAAVAETGSFLVMEALEMCQLHPHPKEMTVVVDLDPAETVGVVVEPVLLERLETLALEGLA